MIRSTLFIAALALLVGSAKAQFPGADGLEVGDDVCVFGFVMDFFCVERGTLLDAPDVVTLKNPELHSLHCLLDVPSCNGSPYHILEPPAEAGGNYSTGWQMSSNDMLLEAGRALGSTDLGCTTCPGNGTLKMGFRAQVKGTVQALEPMPILTVASVEALDGVDAMGCKSDDDATTGDAADANATDSADGDAGEPASASEDEAAAGDSSAPSIMLWTSALLGFAASALVL